MYIDDHLGRCPFEHFQVMDRDLARLELHFLTLTSHFIGFASLHLYGRVGRRGLFDLTHECFQHFFKLLLGYIDGLCRRSYFPICIEGISSAAQTNDRLVSFVGSRNIFT